MGAKLDFAYMHAMAAQVCNFDDASLRNVIDATGSLFHGCRELAPVVWTAPRWI
jgi:hypothetical protein